jgi:hypothetical protein
MVNLSVPRGWRPLVDRAIADIAAAGGQVVDGKSKFAALKLYAAPMTPEIRVLIDAAEGESMRTCEVCGCRGRTRDTGGWWLTACDVHAAWRKEHRRHDETPPPGDDDAPAVFVARFDHARRALALSRLLPDGADPDPMSPLELLVPAMAAAFVAGSTLLVLDPAFSTALREWFGSDVDATVAAIGPELAKSIEGIFGCLERPGTPPFSIAEMNEVIARGWSGEQ